jgi:HEAT repeat protein
MARAIEPFGIPRAIAGRTWVATGTLFVLMAAHALLETARDALFLSALPASRLPYVYLAIAALAVVVARVNRRVTGRFSKRRALSCTLIGAGLVTAAMWLWSGSETSSLYAFYVWTGLVATVAVVQLWLLCGEGIQADEAKRAFALIGAGGLVGATLGASSAGALLRAIEPRDLILVGAGVLVLAGLLPAALWRVEPERAPKRRSRAAPAPESLLGHPYLRRLLLVVILGQLAVTTADLLFKAVVAQEIPVEDLGSFFAFFYAGLNGLSLLVQLVLASWLLRRIGVSRAMWVLPVLLGFGALGFAVTAALVPILLVKVFDGSLRHSLHRTGIELLYLPLPSKLRERYKVTIDAVGARGGQALASLAVLGALALGWSLADVSVILVVVVVLLLASISSIKQLYVELFRQQLKDGTIETRAEVPPLDLHSLEALISGLSSEEDVVALAAIDLLEASGRSSLVTPLILYHPSREVVLRALDLMGASRRPDFIPPARRLLQSVDPEIRAAALRALGAVGGAGEEQVMRQVLVDPAPSVRATALVGLVCTSCKDTGDIRTGLQDILDGPDPDSRVALVRAIRYRPDAAFQPILRQLAETGEPQVQAEVARVIASAPDPAFLPLLLPMLGDRHARPDARAAMVAIGRPALEFLDGALGDESLPQRVRLHLPRTVSRFGGQAAADVLAGHLDRELDTIIGYKILRGLGRMVAENRRLRIDRHLLDRAIISVLRRALDLCDWRAGLLEDMAETTTAAGQLLVALLREKERGALERAFRLLGLRHPDEDFHAIYVGLNSGDGKASASGRELIEYLVEPRRRAAILALSDSELDEHQRLERAAGFYRPEPSDPAERLRRMVADPSDALSGLAAHHAAELGGEFERELGEAIDSRLNRWLQVVEEALRQVAGEEAARRREVPSAT